MHCTRDDDFVGAGRRPIQRFDGCSDGGREALMMAQRYLTDSDGLIAPF
jgi:hypothetical protein